MDNVQRVEVVRLADRLFIEKLIAGRLSEAAYYLERLKSSPLWTHMEKEAYLRVMASEQENVEYLRGLLDRFRLGHIWSPDTHGEHS
jgi:hypothetical protein